MKICKYCYVREVSDTDPSRLDNELDTPVKVPITHSIQNKTWRDVEGHILHNNP